jgi:hypothetical protein
VVVLPIPVIILVEMIYHGKFTFVYEDNFCMYLLRGLYLAYGINGYNVVLLLIFSVLASRVPESINEFKSMVLIVVGACLGIVITISVNILSPHAIWGKHVNYFANLTILSIMCIGSIVKPLFD